MKMKMSPQDRSRLTGINLLFADIDNTISDNGKITQEAYSALWRAHDAGLDVVPTTGRPAGWCDHIARMWPVRGVIGENGGIYFQMTQTGMQKVYACDQQTRDANRERLDSIRADILAAVPGAALASDQPYRELDLAIDYCEDVDPLSKQDVLRIVDIFDKYGATAKVSSIHVNGWFGDFDKLTMAKRFALDVCGIDLEANKEGVAFIGDSPNDQPMFEYFPLSFGVANIESFADDITSPPAFVTDRACGSGFAELIDEITDARSNRQ